MHHCETSVEPAAISAPCAKNTRAVFVVLSFVIAYVFPGSTSRVSPYPHNQSKQCRVDNAFMHRNVVQDRGSIRTSSQPGYGLRHMKEGCVPASPWRPFCRTSFVTQQQALDISLLAKWQLSDLLRLTSLGRWARAVSRSVKMTACRTQHQKVDEVET